MTQGQEILALLADGRWHSTREILGHVPCIVHSRISELRSRGHRIEHQGAGGGAASHSYRLLLDEREVTAFPEAADGPSRSSSGAADPKPRRRSLQEPLFA